MAARPRPTTEGKHSVELSGVPETMLWPLWNRAVEKSRRAPLIDDPLAVGLIDRIDYDFAGRFGKPSVMHAIRARHSDDLIRDYLAQGEEPRTVVALGDGLETQFWRVDDGHVRWLSIDLPEAIAVRRRLLPDHPRAATIAASALDPAWLDAVPRDPPPFITASGLLMYFEQPDVVALLTRLAARFPGAELFFDTIPPYISRRTIEGLNLTKKYTAPPMPWGISLDDIPAFVRGLRRYQVRSIQTYADPFPQRTRLYKLLSYIAVVRRRYAPGLVHLRETSGPSLQVVSNDAPSFQSLSSAGRPHGSHPPSDQDNATRGTTR